METVQEIIAEMERKPDAQYLLGWIQARVGQLPASAIRASIDAFFQANNEMSETVAGDDEPGWATCECGRRVPLTTAGFLYPHDCSTKRAQS